ncbi:MAG: DUF4294 domain-containing protein, partial [Weeksellaceae bacterium]|nr:DUF4294 domain-containing protein [Weeksellaceae bacterium]
ERMDWKILFIFFFFSFTFLLSQEDSKTENYLERLELDSIRTEGEIVWDTVKLDNANIISLRLNTDMEKKYYLWLRKRVRDVWPFVKVAVEEYNSIQDTAKLIHKKRDRRKYIKQRQNVLANEFESQLKDLSTSRGQILIKLIYRETGRTSYDIIKELRGGFNAFLWNTAGDFNNLDLKSVFDPHKTREDLFIEVILQKDFSSGRLERIRDFE